MAFGGYGVWSVPARDRTLANFESKMHYVVRALGGELEKDIGTLGIGGKRKHGKTAGVTCTKSSRKRKTRQGKQAKMKNGKILAMHGIMKMTTSKPVNMAMISNGKKGSIAKVTVHTARLATARAKKARAKVASPVGCRMMSRSSWHKYSC